MTKKLDNNSKKQDLLKKNPRNWCGKYWNNNSIRNIISEVIKPEEIDMSLVKTNDELNPLFWKKDELNYDIRQKLLKIAIEFIKYCKIEDKKFLDIMFVGSNANYNYTQFSDIDIHILLDFSRIEAEPEIIGEYFKAKKELWSLEHDITIDDHSVECYVQSTTEPFTSLGVYSIYKNEWIRKPLKKFINIDEAAIQLKAADIMNKIEILIDEFNSGHDVIEKTIAIKNKIKKLRKTGLYKEGEYSPENLAFKILRNSGYLDKLNKLKNLSFDKSLSLEDNSNNTIKKI